LWCVQVRFPSVPVGVLVVLVVLPRPSCAWIRAGASNPASFAIVGQIAHKLIFLRRGDGGQEYIGVQILAVSSSVIVAELRNIE
jgi:hypothetical protein